MAQKAVVNINGRSYDAATGKPIGMAEPPRRSMDGFTKRPVARPAAVPASQSVHSRIQRTRTLKRTAVAKPQVKKVSAVTHRAPQPAAPVQAAPRTGISGSRLARARMVRKSAQISKFSQAAAVAAPAAPEPRPAPSAAPVRPVAQPEPVRSAPQQIPHVPTVKERLIAEQLDRIEEQPQEQAGQGSGRRTVATAFAGVAATLLLGGYVAYLNIPNMSMRVAASRAGFSASLPGYRPAGYDFSGPIAYSPGQITLQFASNSDERSYRIIQRESNWDSQSLLENFVNEQSDQYITFQQRGLTVFVYEGSNAAWVDSGVWYTIEGDSQLSNDQLLKIAASL